MVPTVRLELTTYCLQDSCTANCAMSAVPLIFRLNLERKSLIVCLLRPPFNIIFYFWNMIKLLEVELNAFHSIGWLYMVDLA